MKKYFAKEDISTWQRNIRDVQRHELSRKRKLRPWLGITKMKTVQIPNVHKAAEKLDLSCTVSGNIKVHSCSEKQYHGLLHPCHRTWLSKKKRNMTYAHNTFDGSQEDYAEWEKVSKGHILYGSIYISFSKWQTINMGNQVTVSQG